jgi:hypothetical protein
MNGSNFAASLIMAALVSVMPAPLLRAAQAPAQAPAKTPPAPPAFHRLPDGKPDLQGYYNPRAGGANFGLEEHAAVYGIPAGKGFVVDPPGGKLPMQDWAKAEQLSRLRPERGYDDPAAHCFQNGLPRVMYTGGFQIMQPPGYVVMLFSGDTGLSHRLIPIGGRSHLPDNVRLWQGDSIGHWEGDTLVVETTNFNGKTWLNQNGEFLSYAATIVERFTPVDAMTINYQATITDPMVYTRPWTIAYPLEKQQDELLEDACQEDDQDLPHLQDLKKTAGQAGPGKAE